MASLPRTPPLHDRSNKPLLPPPLSASLNCDEGKRPGFSSQCFLKKPTTGIANSSKENCKPLDQPTLTEYVSKVVGRARHQGEEASYSGRFSVFSEAFADEAPLAKDVLGAESGNADYSSLREESTISSPSVRKESSARLFERVTEQEASSSTSLCISSRLEARRVEKNLGPVGGKSTVYDPQPSVDKQNLTQSCPPFSRLKKISKKQRVPREAYRDQGIDKVYNMSENNQAGNNKEESTKVLKGSYRRRRRSILAHSAPSSLPDDFIHAQRSHYAAIDAFELEEEEAGSEEE